LSHNIRDDSKVRELKPGVLRSQLEKDFELDGGMQSAATSRYVLKTCHYIKIDVSFSGDGINDRTEFLPTDKMVTVSKPYLEFPVKD
jgi:hypothetical protein